MLNISDFFICLQQVMDYYRLNAAAFADALEIQRSGISHLLSERNKPSLDFILDMFYCKIFFLLFLTVNEWYLIIDSVFFCDFKDILLKYLSSLFVRLSFND